MRKCLIGLVAVWMLIATNAMAQDGAYNVEWISDGNGGYTATLQNLNGAGFTINNFPSPELKPEWVFVGWDMTITATLEAMLALAQNGSNPVFYASGDYTLSGKASFSHLDLNGPNQNGYASDSKDFSQVFELTDSSSLDGPWRSDYTALDEFNFDMFVAAGQLNDPQRFGFTLSGTAVTGDSIVDGTDNYNKTINYRTYGDITIELKARYESAGTPEPATMLILLGGMGALPLVRRLRKK